MVKGKVNQVLYHYAKGKTRRQLMQMGFAKGTVLRQCWEFDKLKASLQYLKTNNHGR
jgi:hypothetical protein